MEMPRNSAQPINAAEITEAMDGWLASPPADMRAALIAWAEIRGISID